MLILCHHELVQAQERNLLEFAHVSIWGCGDIGHCTEFRKPGLMLVSRMLLDMLPRHILACRPKSEE